MVSHTQKGRSHKRKQKSEPPKKVTFLDRRSIDSPKSVIPASPIAPVRYMADKAYVEDFYAWIRGDDYYKELRARQIEDEQLEESNYKIW
jgi:Ni/Co efflux regulator RcnB